MANNNARFKTVAPRASVLIEGMRDIGYTLETALADIIDNSIAAGATDIQILADTHSEDLKIGVLDDGQGMSETELMEAMRPGTMSPLDIRDEDDLGRFGLGLKTASFSQCRRLTVVTRKNSQTSCAIWDLDMVMERDEWVVEIPSDHTTVPWTDSMEGNGTLVVWQKLDRNNKDDLIRGMDKAADHLGFVFHRFMTRDGRSKPIGISLNGRAIDPFDPFHSHHPATQREPEETIRMNGQISRIQAFTLPHHGKVSKHDWERYAGPEGYLRNQGFYLYRNRRLIVHGTWFGLVRQTELTKLARIRIDIPNSLDSDWKIDIKKASAEPPKVVRNRLRGIIDTLGASSRRTYTRRGLRRFQEERLPVWTRHQDKNRIIYGLNSDHPSISSLSNRLNVELRREFRHLINLICSTLPLNTLYADLNDHQESVEATELDGDSFVASVKNTYFALSEKGLTIETIERMMEVSEPYKSRWPEAKSVIETINQETRNHAHRSGRT